MNDKLKLNGTTQTTYNPSANVPTTTSAPLRDYPENELIHVHMVAHSHNDVGWLMTAEEYYQSQVVNILNSVIEALCAN